MTVFGIILTILTIIGSLGLFLYGMVLMSEALQKVAGKRMRKILSTVTSRDLHGIMTGLSITGAIQSSSATTVMIASFVNAGLLSVRKSFSLIMGANIGTTVTAWIIVLLGFGQTFSISLITLPLVAISLPFFFGGKSIQRSWAEFIIGLAILFIGLQFLKENVPAMNEESVFISHFKDLIHYGFFSVLIYVGLGILLTVIFQSSSAVMALTFVLATDGWVPYDMAAAMVLGENIGTTVTVNFAALVANRSTKRAAFFHLLFNVVGVIIALLFFRWFIQGIDVLVRGATQASAFSDASAIPLALAIFHTSFNVINTLIFLTFLDKCQQFINRLIPEIRKGDREKFRLVHIRGGYVSTSELSIVHAKKEIRLMSDIVANMFEMVPALMMEREKRQYEKLFRKIKKYEKITDNIELEITTYLTGISESRLSHGSSEQVRKMLKIVDDLESIGDACRKMAVNIYNKNKEGIYFVQEIRDSLDAMFELVRASLRKMDENLGKDTPDFEGALQIEKEIDNMRDKLRKKHIENLKKEKYDHKTGIVYNDLVQHCERIGDYALNISESLSS